MIRGKECLSRRQKGWVGERGGKRGGLCRAGNGNKEMILIQRSAFQVAKEEIANVALVKEMVSKG